MPVRVIVAALIVSTSVLAGPKKAPTKPPVKASATSAAPAVPAPQGPLYVKFELVDRVESLPEPASRAAATLARQRFADAQVKVLPDDEPEELMNELMKTEKARGFLVRLSISRNKEGGVSAEALVTTFPGRSLRGSWNVGAAGGEVQEMVEAIVPKVLEDAFGDLGWATAPAQPVATPDQQ